MVALAAVIVICCCILFKQSNEYKMEDENIREIGSVAAGYVVSNPNAEILEEELITAPEITDISALKAINPDTYGKLIVPGTGIDFIVMKSDDEDKYLQTDFYGNPAKYGSIFVSPLSDLDSYNMLIQGHHMKNGAMFGGLSKFLDESYRNEHDTILFISEDNVWIYKVAAAFPISTDEEPVINSLKLINDEDKASVETKAKEAGKLYLPLSGNDKFITLVTCEYSHEDGRLLVIGTLIDCLPVREES